MTSIEAADDENVAFLVLYAMPLFTSQFNTLDWKLWLPLGAMFVIIAMTGYCFHFNPLLNLLGWHFYRVTSPDGVTFILITRKHLRTISKDLPVVQLTEYVLVDRGVS